MQQHSNRELWLAFVAMLVISLVYLFMVKVSGGIPAASDFFGHAIGVLGFILMLMTETLYSLRKRSRSARWGRMASWLQFHIFTGLVGPFMVLLHTSWKFNGLAGLVFLLTVIIVVSGVIGRYIYTAIPRTVDGAEVTESVLARQIREIEMRLNQWRSENDELAAQTQGLWKVSEPQPGVGAVLGRLFQDWVERYRWWVYQRGQDAALRQQTEKLAKLIRQRRTLRRQMSSLAMARRLLALWHTVHIPIGIALFTTAFIHIGAAIYYATLLR